MLICHLSGRVSPGWLPAVPPDPRHCPGGGEEPGQDDQLPGHHQGRVHGPGVRGRGGPRDRVPAAVRAPALPEHYPGHPGQHGLVLQEQNQLRPVTQSPKLCLSLIQGMKPCHDDSLFRADLIKRNESR